MNLIIMVFSPIVIKPFCILNLNPKSIFHHREPMPQTLLLIHRLPQTVSQMRWMENSSHGIRPGSGLDLALIWFRLASTSCQTLWAFLWIEVNSLSWISKGHIIFETINAQCSVILDGQGYFYYFFVHTRVCQ